LRAQVAAWVAARPLRAARKGAARATGVSGLFSRKHRSAGTAGKRPGA